MSALFRSLNSGFSTKRENAIKDAILEALQENVKEIEYDVHENKKGEGEVQLIIALNNEK